MNRVIEQEGSLQINWVMLLWLLISQWMWANSVQAQTPHRLPPTSPVVHLATGEWQPFITAKDRRGGPLTTVVREAFEAERLEVELVFHPWKRAMEEVRVGSVSAGYAWRITKGRAVNFLFSDAIYEGENVFFHLKGSGFHWEILEDLGKYRLGGVLGYAYSAELADLEAEGEVKLDRVQNERSLFEMLKNRRIDAFPSNREVGLKLLKEMPVAFRKQVAVHPQVLSRAPLSLIAPKTQAGEAVMSVFQQGLKKLKDSGRYDEIYEQFNAKDNLAGSEK